MKNAAIDRTVGKIVITSDSERVPTTKKRYASALLVVHLLNRLPCPRLSESNFSMSGSKCPNGII